MEEVTIPKRKGNIGKGFAFIRFAEPECAINAYSELDQTFFCGRKIHIKPAMQRPPTLNEITGNLGGDQNETKPWDNDRKMGLGDSDFKADKRLKQQ